MTTFRRLEVFDVSQNDADLAASPPQTNLPPASQAIFIGVDSLGKFWINGAQVSGGGGSSVSVNGSAVTTPNFNATTPAAPGSSTNVVWAFDGSGNISASAQLAITKSSVASNWLNSYNSATGAFTASQPAFTDISGSVSAGQIPAGTVTWDKLGNAAGNLTLANAGFTTTVNQTSAVAVTLANITAATNTVSQSSPLLTLAGTYWTGAASATDQWTIQDVVANGTNGTSLLTFAHSGTTGQAAVVLPAGTIALPSLQFSGAGAGTGLSAGSSAAFVAINSSSASGGGIQLNASGSSYGSIASDNASGVILSTASFSTGDRLTLVGRAPNTAAFSSVVQLGSVNAVTFSSTAAGSVVAVAIGLGSNSTSNGNVNFNPTSGSTNLVALNINPYINQTGTASGSYTGLQVNVVENALLGTSNKLLDLQSGVAGGVSRFNVDNSGLTTELTANGAAWTHGQASELLTLSTVGLTTDTAANLLPANSIIESVVCRVTTTITTTTNWAVGDSVQSARFSSPNATLTAGTTSVGLNQADPTVASANLGPVQTSAAKVRITCTGSNPGAGAIRITVFYRQFVAPTS